MQGSTHTTTDSSADNRLCELVHDIRHCLHVLRIGRELLQSVEEPTKRQEICESMASEERSATVLLDELVAIARAAQSRKS